VVEVPATETLGYLAFSRNPTGRERENEVMLNKRHLLAGFALALVITPFTAAVAPVAALDKTPFDAKAFEDAQAAGKPILVEVTAPWCPTCKAQAPILARLSSTPKFKDMVRFNIDFDTQKDLLRKFNVRLQSTMIAFKGKQEVGRSTGDTNASSIERLLEKSI
jgi:thiol-disulfide isomerase/thioredoxin